MDGYQVNLQHTPPHGWIAIVPDLPGCLTCADTAQQALVQIKESIQLWLEIAAEDGDPIPQPKEVH